MSPHPNNAASPPDSRPPSRRGRALLVVIGALWLAAIATLIGAVLQTPAAPRAMVFRAGQRMDPWATCGGPELLLGDVLWTTCEAFETGQYWLTRADFSTATAALQVQLPGRPSLLIESAAGDLGLVIDGVVYEVRQGSDALIRHFRGRVVQDLAYRDRTLWALDGTTQLSLRSGDREESLMTLQAAPGRTLMPMPGRLRLWDASGTWRVITIDAPARPRGRAAAPDRTTNRRVVWTEDGRTLHTIAELPGDQRPVMLAGAVDRHTRAGLLLQRKGDRWRPLKPPLQAQLRFHALRQRRLPPDPAAGSVDWLLTSYRAGAPRGAKRLGRVAGRWLFLGEDGYAGAVGWTQNSVAPQMSAAVELRVLPHGDGYLLVNGMRLAFAHLDADLRRVDAPNLPARLVGLMRSAGRLSPDADPTWWVQLALVWTVIGAALGGVGWLVLRRRRT